MALFPVDEEPNHVSVVNVPDDTHNYMVKDTYARELTEILNDNKSEVYYGNHKDTDNPGTFMLYCDISPKHFAKGADNATISIKSGMIDVDFTGSPVTNYRFNTSTTIWEELVTGIDPHVSPIRMRFHTSPNGQTKIIYSDIILSYTEIVDPSNPNVIHDRYFSGTGIIYTGADIDSCVYVAVRMQIQPIDVEYQYDIYVKELTLK